MIHVDFGYLIDYFPKFIIDFMYFLDYFLRYVHLKLKEECGCTSCLERA